MRTRFRYSVRRSLWFTAFLFKKMQENETIHIHYYHHEAVTLAKENYNIFPVVEMNLDKVFAYNNITAKMSQPKPLHSLPLVSCAQVFIYLQCSDE